MTIRRGSQRAIVRVGAMASALALAFLATAHPGVARAEDDPPKIYVGTVSYISATDVEVSGPRGTKRGNFTQESLISSDGRSVFVGSIRRDMPAELEIDEAGRVVSLIVKGVVE